MHAMRAGAWEPAWAHTCMAVPAPAWVSGTMRAPSQPPGREHAWPIVPGTSDRSAPLNEPAAAAAPPCESGRPQTNTLAARPQLQ
eukprot:364911-Chlamydomonas_euryale.AAC.1